MGNCSLKFGPPVHKPLWPAILLKVLAVVLTLAAALLVRIPGEIRGYACNLFRDVYRMQVLLGTRNLPALSGEHFLVKYHPGDFDGARLVLETAEQVYEPVAREFGFTSRGPLLVIVHSSRQELNACFGWSAGTSAMGAYWAGVIRVLSPEVWIPEEEEHLRNVFVSSGPVIHELTHLVVDYITGGNVPRWFTEGLSQYEEYRLTGFKFEEPAGLLEQTPYFFKTMDGGFDELPDQTLAYWQSLSAIQYMAEEYGKDSVHQILKVLAGGDSIDKALYGVLGVTGKEFQADWWRWVTVKRSFPNNSRQELQAS